jgi:dUTP pyrophosphatase
MKIEMQVLPHADARDCPMYATAGAAGADLRSCQHVTLLPGERAMVATGVALAIPAGYEGQIRSRSGLASQAGVIVLNQPGTIDSDYRGEIKVLLLNVGSAPATIPQGTRIAQIVIAPVVRAEFVPVAQLSETARQSGGFGSTGAV